MMPWDASRSGRPVSRPAVDFRDRAGAEGSGLRDRSCLSSSKRAPHQQAIPTVVSGVGPIMSKRILSLGLGLALSAALTFVGLRLVPHVAEAAPNPPTVPARDTPVLVELFTSEGCSSCPPADGVVTRLAQTQPVAGARVIVLAHHVDYWNELGWTDPFSSAAATARQRAYARLGGGSYTPQAVVDGRAEVVGSRESALVKAVADSSKRAHATIDVRVVPSPSTRGAFDVMMKVGALPEGSSSDVELLLAVVQDQGRVTVSRGENAGRTLDHAAIARSLERISPIAIAGGSAQTVVQVPAVVAADAPMFSVVAFVQERASRRVLGSASAPLATP
jgi:hypothetical protein